MPVYLCQPGSTSKEPWRHGVEVYDRPAPLDSADLNASAMDSGSGGVAGENATGADGKMLAEEAAAAQQRPDTTTTDDKSNEQQVSSIGITTRNQHQQQQRFLQNHMTSHDSGSDFSLNESGSGGHYSGTTTTLPANHGGRKLQRQPLLPAPNTVRRVRHAEVVLADQALLAYGRYWLRIRWPGEHGGFGGFVALGRATAADVDAACDVGRGDGDGNNLNEGRKEDGDMGGTTGGVSSKNNNEEEVVLCQEIPPPSSTSPTATTSNTTRPSTILCQETNVYYPTSSAMKLLALYDDGLSGEGDGDAIIGGIGSMEEALLGSLENGEVSTVILGWEMLMRGEYVSYLLSLCVFAHSYHSTFHPHNTARLLPNLSGGTPRCQL